MKHYLTDHEQELARKALGHYSDVAFEMMNASHQDLSFIRHDLWVLKAFTNPKYKIAVEIDDKDFDNFTNDNGIDYPMYDEEQPCDHCGKACPEGLHSTSWKSPKAYCEECKLILQNETVKIYMKEGSDYVYHRDMTELMKVVKMLEVHIGNLQTDELLDAEEFMDQYAHIMEVNGTFFVGGSVEAIFDNVVQVITDLKKKKFI